MYNDISPSFDKSAIFHIRESASPCKRYEPDLLLGTKHGRDVGFWNAQKANTKYSILLNKTIQYFI